MKNDQSTGRVRVIKPPAGEPPAHISSAWVGLILPCQPQLGFARGILRGVTSGVEIKNASPGVSVPQDLAIQLLEQHAPDAAQWWRAEGYPKEDEYFFFQEEEIEIVSGVFPQQLTHVPEEAQGQANR